VIPILSHNGWLTDILDELRIAPRLSGTQACDEAGQRLVAWFREIGYRPETVEYSFIGWSVPEPPEVVNVGNGQKYPSRALTWCGGVRGVRAEGQVVPKGEANFWGLGTIRTYERWAVLENDVERKDVYLIGQLGHHLVLPYPMHDTAYVGMEKEELRRIHQSKTRLNVTVRTDLRIGARSANITAVKKGDTEDEIVVCAYHDTVYDDENGLHDNGGACVVLLLLAEQLRTTNTKHTIRFLSTGGEEFNLIGARSYLEQREVAGTLDRVRACINLDYITQKPEVVKVECTEDFDEIVRNQLSVHGGREYAYKLDGRISRELGCLDACAFEERDISSIWYCPMNPEGQDEDNTAIAANLRANAAFVKDILLQADSMFSGR